MNIYCACQAFGVPYLILWILLNMQQKARKCLKLKNNSFKGKDAAKVVVVTEFSSREDAWFLYIRLSIEFRSISICCFAN